MTAYNSCGLGIIEAKAATEEAKKLLAEGGYGAGSPMELSHHHWEAAEAETGQ